MKFSLRQSPELLQTITEKLTLEQRLGQRLRLEQRQIKSKFEKQVLKKVKFHDIELDGPEGDYHMDILGSLVFRESGDFNDKISGKESLIAQIMKANNSDVKNVQKILVEAVDVQDVDLDLGTKRNVDLITIMFDKGRQFRMTASIDKEMVADITDSPSYHESQVLSGVDSNRAWSVQKFFGFKTIEYEDWSSVRGLVCKEFVEGQVLGNLTSEANLAEEPLGGLSAEEMAAVMDEIGSEDLTKLAYALGKMLANALMELGGVPRDSNPLNIIVSNVDSKNVLTRYCDVEEVRQDDEGILQEISLLMKEVGQFAPEVLRSLKENYNGPRRQLLERI